MSRTVRLPTLEPATQVAIDVALKHAGLRGCSHGQHSLCLAFRQAGRPKDENLKEIKRKSAS